MVALDPTLGGNLVQTLSALCCEGPLLSQPLRLRVSLATVSTRSCSGFFLNLSHTCPFHSNSISGATLAQVLSPVT